MRNQASVFPDADEDANSFTSIPQRYLRVHQYLTLRDSGFLGLRARVQGRPRFNT